MQDEGAPEAALQVGGRARPAAGQGRAGRGGPPALGMGMGWASAPHLSLCGALSRLPSAVALNGTAQGRGGAALRRPKHFRVRRPPCVHAPARHCSLLCPSTLHCNGPLLHPPWSRSRTALSAS